MSLEYTEEEKNMIREGLGKAMASVDGHLAALREQELPIENQIIAIHNAVVSLAEAVTVVIGATIFQNEVNDARILATPAANEEPDSNEESPIITG